MPLEIGDKKLIPAPLVNIQRQMTFAADGRPLNSLYNVSLQGTILPNKGSPTSYGWHIGLGDPADESFSTDTDKFNSILLKQEWLRDAFASTGYKLSYSAPGFEAVEFYPKFNGITFTPGTWVIKCDYEVSLETPEIQKVNTNSDAITFGSGYAGLNLTAISDDYSIKERDDGTEILEISRNISATAGFNFGASGTRQPWENARLWVLGRKRDVPFGTGYINVISSTGYVYSSGVSYNLIEEESINQLGGQYSLAQRFIFHYRNYIETRTVSKTFDPNKGGAGGPDVVRININGQIIGLDPNNIPANKLANASGYWVSATGLIAASVGAIGRPLTSDVTMDLQNGTVNYAMNFINNSGIYYTHTYDVSYQTGQDNPSVTINGTIEGYTPDDYYSGAGSYYSKFDNAATGWAAISPTLKTLAFAYPSIIASGSLFGDNPLTRNVSFNKANGTINYTYNFAYTSGASNTYQHSYSIDLETSNATPSVNYAGVGCTVTVNGAITGFDTGNPQSKVDNARTGWTAIHSTLYALANAEYYLLGTNKPALASGFTRKTIGVDTKGGVVTYSVGFANNRAASSSGVAVEDVQIDDVNPQDLFAIQNIPGRLTGPIIQNIATTTEYRRNINIVLTMFPKGASPYYWSYSDKSTPAAIASGIIAGLVPAGIRGSGYWFAGDSEAWNYLGGLYSRNVSIVY